MFAALAEFWAAVQQTGIAPTPKKMMSFSPGWPYPGVSNLAALDSSTRPGAGGGRPATGLLDPLPELTTARLFSSSEGSSLPTLLTPRVSGSPHAHPHPATPAPPPCEWSDGAPRAGNTPHRLQATLGPGPSPPGLGFQPVRLVSKKTRVASLFFSLAPPAPPPKELGKPARVTPQHGGRRCAHPERRSAVPGRTPAPPGSDGRLASASPSRGARRNRLLAPTPRSFPAAWGSRKGATSGRHRHEAPESQRARQGP